jgi:hypothetical protein
MSNFFFGKQPIQGSWIFLIAAVPWVLTALFAYEYGGFYFYIVPAVLCLVQYFYPTRFLWGCFFGIFTLAAVVYTGFFAVDLVRIIIGAQPDVFVDLDDSVMVLMFWSVLVFVPLFLFTHRPDLSSESENAQPTSEPDQKQLKKD